jgi:5-methylcytosine-specific restriction endonuclease McrA
VKDRYEIDLSLWRQNKLIIKSDDIPESIRKYMFLKHSSKCQKCGWSSVNSFTKKIPLQVHHIDGNHRNNLEENLELLCPNCHSLTETFGSRNRGKGRDARRSWRKKQKTD